MLFEYVTDHHSFYEVLIMSTHDSSLIVVVHKSDRQEAVWSAYLRLA